MQSILPVALLLTAILPAVHAQATLNLSHDLVRLGIASQDMAPNQPTLDAGPLLASGVAYAVANQFGRVIADTGTYYFLSLQGPSVHVQLGGTSQVPQVSNLTIDFQGSDLIFTHTLQYGIILWDNSNVTLENFTADFQPLPFTQLRVVAVDTASAQIQYSVEPGWQDPSAFNSVQLSPGAGPLAIEVHIFRNGRPAYGTRRMASQTPFSGNRFTISSVTPADMAKIRPGDIAVVAMRQFGEALVTRRCRGCTLRNITVYSGASAAVDGIYSDSTVWERIYSIPKPGTDRLISTFGIGFEAAGPNNQVRLSRAIRTLDGGITFYVYSTGDVLSQPSVRSLTVGGTNSTISQGITIATGSPVVFQSRSDGSILGSATVVSQTGSTDVSINPNPVTFSFDRDLPANLTGSVMYTTDTNQRGGNSLIERNAIEEKSVCCIAMDIWGWAASTFRGNYFSRSPFAPIWGMNALAGIWTTPPLVDVTLRDNVVDGANMTPDWWLYELGAIEMVTLGGDAQAGYALMPTSSHRNITVANNFIANPGRSAVWIGNTTGGNVSGNYFLHPDDRPELAIPNPPKTDLLAPLIVDTTSSGIATSNNTVDQTSGHVFVTDTQYRELAGYAPGATIRLSAYNLGALASPAIVLTDADGKSVPVTIQNTTTHALDVQLPPAAGLGGAYLTLTSSGAKYFGTLFVDSQDNVPAVNGCVYEISPSASAVPVNGGSLSYLVITQSGCSYQATDADSFVILGGAASGTGVISATFTANAGTARSTTIEIAGQPITVAQNQTPTVSPAAATGALQNYTFQFSDTGGYQALTVVNVLINVVLDGRQACYLAYSVTDNVLYVVPDNGDSTQITGKVMNGSGTAGNSQCSVNLAASSASGSGNTLTLHLAMSFAPSFAGNKVIYLAARNASGGNSGWSTMGVLGVPPLPAAPPLPLSVTPASGSAANATLTFTFQDATDANNIQTVWVLINTAIDGRNACYLAYYQPNNHIYLYPDNGDGSQAANTFLSLNNSLSNSQCQIFAQGSGVTRNGNQFTLTLNLSFKPGFTGPRGIWLAAQTTGAAQTSAWQALGAWVVGASVLADSSADFSSTQGAKNWYYGYFNAGNVNGFAQLPLFDAPRQLWSQSPGSCCLLVGQTLMHPNVVGNVEQWSVREWISPFAGQATISGKLYKVDTNPNSTGVYGRIYLNHQQIYNQFIAGTDGTGVTFSLPVTFKAGDILDFALAPNANSLSNDSTYFSAKIATAFAGTGPSQAKIH